MISDTGAPPQRLHIDEAGAVLVVCGFTFRARHKRARARALPDERVGGRLGERRQPRVEFA